MTSLRPCWPAAGDLRAAGAEPDDGDDGRQGWLRRALSGGGATGYAKALLEANLNVSEMCAAGTEIAAVTTKPLILDGATGFGDPMHMHRTIPMVETAGFAAIEIEDQLIPKRAHHHVGVERMIEPELMAAKVEEACAARRSEDFVIIARTNAVRNTGIEDAIKRLELYKKAGADVLLGSPRNAEEARFLGERLPAPLMYLCSPGGLTAIGLSKEEMAALGWQILADPGTGPVCGLRDLAQALCGTGGRVQGHLPPAHRLARTGARHARGHRPAETDRGREAHGREGQLTGAPPSVLARGTHEKARPPVLEGAPFFERRRSVSRTEA